MADDKRHNGWTNYETWIVALWIDNDQTSYNRRHEMSQKAWDDAEITRGYASQTREDSAKYLLSEALKAWIENASPLQRTTVYTDLLNAALGEVNWYEIADTFLEDVDKTSGTLDLFSKEVTQ